jgi:hypothetical protein
MVRKIRACVDDCERGCTYPLTCVEYEITCDSCHDSTDKLYSDGYGNAICEYCLLKQMDITEQEINKCTI